MKWMSAGVGGAPGALLMFRPMGDARFDLGNQPVTERPPTT